MSKQNRPADTDIGSALRASVRPKMTPHEIEFMLAASIRSPYVYLCAKDRLSDSTLFDSSEAKYVLLWRSASSAAEDNRGKLPTDPVAAKEIVASHMAAEMATDVPKRYYTANVEREVCSEGGLLDAIYSLPMDQAVEDRGIDLLAKFVRERKVGDPLRRALAGLSNQETLGDPSELIAQIERHACDLGGLGSDPGSAAFVDSVDILPPGPMVMTTGIMEMDELLNGGHAPKEVYVLLGGSSAGKTALAGQISLEGAKLQSALAAELGADKAGHWYYFTWELSEDELRARFYGYAARIHADSFKRDPITRQMVALSTAQNPATLKEYELDPFINSPGNPVRGELERVQEVNRRMSGANNRLVIVDYSAHSEAGGGTGGVDEIARYLHRERARGRRVEGVVIDYAGLVVKRYINHNRMRPADEYILLEGFVNEVRSKVAIPYEAKVWVPHQLHGSVTKRSPGVKAHYSDARGCKNFSDNADFSIEMGNRNKTTGLIQLSCSKHRRAPGREDGVILKFDGRFGAFLSPDQTYVVDPHSKRIVPRDFLGTMTEMVEQRLANGGNDPPVDPRVGL